jgi:hypothetical protein
MANKQLATFLKEEANKHYFKSYCNSVVVIVTTTTEMGKKDQKAADNETGHISDYSLNNGHEQLTSTYNKNNATFH